MNQQMEAPARVRPVNPAVHPAVKTAPPAWLILAAFAAVYVIWGSTYLGIHIAIQSIPPLLMAGGRFVIAGALLYAVMRLRGAPRPDAGHWLTSAAIGALLLLGGNGGVTWAQQTVPTNIAALVVAATPLWMNLFDWLRPRGTRPRLAVALGLILGFAGVACIVMGRDHLGNRVVEPLGAIMLLVATITWASGSVYSKYARQPSPALLAIAMQMICGGMLLLLTGAALGETRNFHPQAITAASAAAFVYLTTLGSLIGFTAYVWLLQVSTPARVSTYAYVNPLIAVLLGRLALGEPFPKSLALAGGLILGAVILITLAKRRTEVVRLRD
jgi:drug/metabolite transporter (DMT)-like permease